MLAVKLDNILIDNKKIHANFPRFNINKAINKGEALEDRPRAGNQDTIRTTSRNFGNCYAKVGERFFTEGVNNGRIISEPFPKKPFVHLKFQTEEAVLASFRKAYMGVVINPDMSYNIQTSFKIEGYFSIKVTPLGANLCLLEESDPDELRNLIRDAKSLWS